MFTEVIEALHSYVHPAIRQPAPLVADDVYEVIMANADRFNSAIIYDRDFKLLERWIKNVG